MAEQGRHAVCRSEALKGYGWPPRALSGCQATATPVHPSTNTEIFDFEGHNVRTVLIDNEPWFVLADVCKVLEVNNPRQVKTRLDSKDVATVTTNDGSQNKTIINESGLYDVILDSRKPQATTTLLKNQ